MDDFLDVEVEMSSHKRKEKRKPHIREVRSRAYSKRKILRFSRRKEDRWRKQFSDVRYMRIDQIESGLFCGNSVPFDVYKQASRILRMKKPSMALMEYAAECAQYWIGLDNQEIDKLNAELEEEAREMAKLDGGWDDWDHDVWGYSDDDTYW